MNAKTCNISETVQDRTKVIMTEYALSIGTKINDLGRLSGTLAETMRFTESTRKIE